MIIDLILNIIDFIGRHFIWKYGKINRKLAEEAYNDVLEDTGSIELAKEAKEIKEEQIVVAKRMKFWNKASKLFE